MKDRLVALDVFRGLTVALMILVNNPGSWAHIYAPLRHAAWHGLTPTDLVFPFFLFIVGVAVSLGFARRREAGASRRDLVRKIVSRSALIFACGLLLNGFPYGLPLNAAAAAEFGLGSMTDALANLRIMGVLQRIALCYFVVGLLAVLLSGRRRLLAGAGLLIAYELAMRLPLVAGWGAGSFGLEDNFVRWFDLQVLTASHMHRTASVAFDPEGLVSTLPAAVTTLAGFYVGEYLRTGPARERLGGLTAGGLAAVAAGLALMVVEPVNKQLWTVSYVAVTGGLASLVLAASCWFHDVRGWRTGTLPAVIYGSNPLVVFLGSGLMARLLTRVQIPAAEGAISLQRGLYEGVCVLVANPLAGSFLHALLHTVFWWLVSWWMWRRKIFIKI